MKLIDRSPGRFMVLTFAVVYGVILTEAAMWTAASALAVAGTLVLIAVTALIIGHALHRLLDDEDGDVPHAV
jgi:membrane protein YdbS with pleckstrin-like domain